MAELKGKKRGARMTKEQKCLIQLAAIKVQEEELLERKQRAEKALEASQAVKPAKILIEADYVDTLLERIENLERDRAR